MSFDNENYNTYKLKDFAKRITRKNKHNISNLPLTISAQHGLIDQVSFFNKTVASKNMSGYYLLKKGEFAYNKSYSKDYPWGAIKRLDKYEQGCLSTLYICFKCNSDMIDSNYLVHYFESTKWHKQVSNIAGEGARNHGLLNIAIDDFFATKHMFPSLKSQEKIATFLSLIDKRIQTQIKIITEYESYINKFKEQVLISFSNNLTLTISDACSITTGKLDANAMKENGKYRFYTCAENYYFIDEYAFDTEALLISGNGANVGYIHYYKGKFNAYQRTYVLSDFKVNPLILKLNLDVNLKKRIKEQKNTGNTPYIKLDTISKMKIFLLNKDDEYKIIKTINLIEQKIEYEKKILEFLKKQKSFLLDNLFI